jgi:acyl-CoA reductase-like NAD-dependent aldehyde dehydrogenase
VVVSLDDVVNGLGHAADRWQQAVPASRSTLAQATARSVADQAEAWVAAAVALKSAGQEPSASVAAEETATGPLATLRLLLTTARVWREIGGQGLPRPAAVPRMLHAAGPGSLMAVDVLPEPRLLDRIIFGGHSATVRCGNPGSLDAFAAAWRAEAASRPRSGGVAAVLGAGNVTGLAAADAIDQIFAHGRAVLLKLHPLHAPLKPIYREALAPLREAGLLEIVVGGVEVATAAVAAPGVSHVHLTGGKAAFDAIVWGGEPRAGAEPLLRKSITCELGNVTPWIIVPGRYTPQQLRFQADLVAGSIANNTSFNCIATKCLVTCRQWPQRDEFLRLVAGRLGSLAPRPAWFPGSAAAWEAAAGLRPPDDGCLPWTFLTGIDAGRDRRLLDHEWFVPVATEVPLDAADIEAFCGRATEFAHVLPGSLAASVTLPDSLSAADQARAELLVEHLRYGVVAVNTWSALAYAMGSVPWGGYPGATLREPASGIGHVHDPLLLPLVHNTILRAPLASGLPPAWLPWHPTGTKLARGLLGVYSAVARGRSGLVPFLRLIPPVLAGGRA